MRKFVSICLVLLLVLCILPEAWADVIFEPMDDFYAKHREDCQYLDRSYTAKGPNGDVTAYESPESDKVILKIDNGTAVYISYVYEDASGVMWGFNGGWDAEAGWIPMDYLELIYDFMAFEEEHSQEFVAQEDYLDSQWQGKDVYFWEYPGCPEPYRMALDEVLPRYTAVYTDANGTRWGRGSYYYGMREYWINLDAPDADYLGDPAATQPTQEPAAAEPVDEIKPAAQGGGIYAIIAVAAVVAVTILLLVKLKKRK